MFKKLPLSLIGVLFAFASYGQTIVSTSPENQNAILEEFTGMHCVFCPDGHAVANGIKAAHPDDFFIINVHEGSLSVPAAGEPDFRTPWGSALASQSQRNGWPTGTINRHVFPGRGVVAGATAMSRSFWSVSTNETIAITSDVNVGVEATIDVQTRVMTVHVEAYYTSDSPASTNMLNVALLQNNTKGPQTGGNMGDEYVHQHRLVDLLTGQWGEAINNTTTGSFVDRTYTYTIPAMYNNVPAELADMEIVAFIANTHQEIPTGTNALPSYTGITNANDAYVREVADIDPICSDMVAPKVDIQNLGSDPITSLEITYTINGDANVYNWTGNITALQTQTIELPAVNFTLQASNTLDISVPNDDNNTNNTGSTTFDEAVGGTGTVTMELHTDAYGSECRWNLKDGAGNIVDNGGPYGNNQTIYKTFQLPEDCYSFSIIDTYGDGGGMVKLTDSDGTQIFYTNGNYGSGKTGAFTSNGVLGVGSNELSNISLYPNPATSIINLRNAENANIQVYDVLGKLILSQNNISAEQEINVSQLQMGTYFMKIEKDNFVTTKRFIISN